MIVKSAFAKLLKPGLAWLWFCHYYPKYKRSDKGKHYYKKRRAAFKRWIKSLPKLRMND